MNFIVTTAPGLEELLQKELSTFGIEASIEAAGAALRFEGDWEQAACVLNRSRLASRLLVVIRSFSARNAEMLYDQTRRVPWQEHFVNFEHTFAVFAHGETSKTDFNTQFAALKIKDAICDELKKLQGGRPDVNRTNPDIRVEAFFYNGKAELSVDLAGDPLHRRGYRQDSGEAPLRENRAAGMLLFAGYDGTQTLVDPFCGSGTIAIEAALIAQNRAPGLLRDLNSFAGARIYPPLLHALEKERFESQKRVCPAKAPILASDISGQAVDLARANMGRAGCTHVVKLDHADARKLRIQNALIVCNPPYGERLMPEESASLISDFVRQVKHFCAPAKLVMILQEGEIESAVGLKPSKQLKVENGPISAKFLEFEIFAGSLADRKKVFFAGRS